MILSKKALGQALRDLIKKHYRYIKEAQFDLDYDERELRRCWAKSERNGAGWLRILALLNRLGYEVHFTIVKKGSTNGTLSG